MRRQHTFDNLWREQELSDHDENARVFAKMRTAVEVAHDVAAIRSTADFERRLAYLLRYLYFCGGTSSQGCRAYVSTIARGTKNGIRTTERLLRRGRDLLLVITSPGPRQNYNRLNMPWIKELVSDRRRKVAEHRGKVAEHNANSVGANRQSGGPPPQDRRSNRKQEYSEKLVSLTWDEFAELVESEELAKQCLMSVNRMTREYAEEAINTGQPMPDWVVDRLLDTLDAKEETGQERGRRAVAQ